MTTAPHSAWSSTAWRELLASPAYASLRPTARLVFQTLRNYSDVTGRPCWPSVATLATACGIQVRACRASLATLEAAGLITREYRHAPDGSPTSTVYHFARPSGLRLMPHPPVPACRTSGSCVPQKEEQGIKIIKNQEQPDSPSGLRPTGERAMSRQAQDPQSQAILLEAPPDMRQRDPEKDSAPPPDPVARARERLADPTHHEKQAKTAKSAAAALVNYWHDRRATTDPGVKPPTPTPKDRGQAGHVISRFMVPGVEPVAAFRQARALVDAAFRRVCWPWKGNADPVELASLGNRRVFDALRAAEAERLAALPDWQRKGFATFADWVEAENARGGFRRVG